MIGPGHAGLICTVNACAVSIADGTAANGCDTAAIKYVDILDVCNNEFIIRVSPVLCNTVLVSNCNEGEEGHHVVIAVVPGVGGALDWGFHLQTSASSSQEFGLHYNGTC